LKNLPWDITRLAIEGKAEAADRRRASQTHGGEVPGYLDSSPDATPMTTPGTTPGTTPLSVSRKLPMLAGTPEHSPSKRMTTTEALQSSVSIGSDPRDVIKDYITAQLDRNLIPLPFLLRQDMLRSLELSSAGMGDNQALALSMVLPRLAHVESLRLSDNRLSDQGVRGVVRAARAMPRLVTLDLSRNKIDDSASAEIRDFVASNVCMLRTLVLRAADIDDLECRLLMTALAKNRSITAVDLSRNLIGAMEGLSLSVAAGIKDLTGGAQAGNVSVGCFGIAEMLRRNTTLTQLDLSWNNVRKLGAVCIARALAKHPALRVLHLANNSFGEAGAMWLGRSVLRNRSLQTLDLSFNALTPRGALVLASSLKVSQLGWSERSVRSARSSNDGPL
jgi:Ran GTPase-activating protein (RanGAP) involved in mRNA processing and transport